MPCYDGINDMDYLDLSLPDLPTEQVVHVGDYVRCRMKPDNFGIITKMHKNETGYYIDVFWLTSHKEITFCAVNRFILVRHYGRNNTIFT